MGLSFYSTAEEALQGAVLTGKTAIVTGGNAGLGAETVRVLAGAGADVIMCSRSVSRGQEAADGIATGLATAAAVAAAAGKSAPAPGKITVVPLDLADLKSVQAFAKQPAVAGLKAIHLLVLNAGRRIMGLPSKQLTAQGLEVQWGTNHVGHQHLAQLLLPRMKVQGAPARVVALTSFGHNFAPRPLPLDDLSWERRTYSAWPAYGQAKLSNALFARELARRMAAEGAPISAFSVHPGFINTNLSKDITGGAPLRLLWRGIDAVPGLAGLLGFKSVAQGAATTIFACTAPELEERSGEYLADCQIGSEVPGLWGKRFCAPNKQARDGELARALWEKTEETIAAALARV